MAAALDIDTVELELCLKGLLISKPTVIKATQLLRECEELLEKRFPYRQLGFSTFVDYLRSIPTVVKLQPHNSSNPEVHPVASKASLHIDKLVSKQRVAPPRRTYRRGGYRGSIGRPPIRRRTTQSRPLLPTPSSRPLLPTPSNVRPHQVDQDFNVNTETLDPKFMTKILWELVKKVASSKSGVSVRELEAHMRSTYHPEDLTRNRIRSVNDVLAHAHDMVEGDDWIQPKLSARPDMTTDTNEISETNGIPGGMEDDYEYEEIDYLEDSEFWENVPEEQISEYTINLCSQALGHQENGTSSLRDEASGETLEVEESIFIEDESSISDGMINNFRKILAKNTDGIWASELQHQYFYLNYSTDKLRQTAFSMDVIQMSEYFYVVFLYWPADEEFHVALDLLDVGYTSVISLVSSLPNVFTYQRAGPHDWKLYDARLVKPEDLISLGNEQDDDLSQYIESKVLYVPKDIIEKIKKLLEEYPGGFRSTDLLELYKQTFNKSLDLDCLGFKSMEDFLQTLKEDITVRKVTNYYLLLPKHKTVPYEAIEPTKPDAILKLSPETLSGFSIPEGVLRPGDEIPLQELPPVKMDADPTEPLLELAVRVAEVISPALFYMVLDSQYNELQNMMDDLHKFYEWEQEKYHILLPHITLNLICAHPYSVCEGDTKYWHRAKIVGFKKNGAVKIEYIDYGTPAETVASELRYLSKEFATLPAQAFCAKLYGVQPLNGAKMFPKDVSRTFLDLVGGKRLMAHIYQVGSKRISNKENMQLELFLYDTTGPTEMVLNDYLVEKGLAMAFNQTEDVPTSDQQTVAEESKLANTPVPVSSSQPEEKKRPIRPPPGFELQVTPANPSFDFNTTSSLPPTNQRQESSNAQFRASNSLTADQQQQVYINNYFIGPPPNAESLPALMQQQLLNQYLAQQQMRYYPQMQNNQMYLPPNMSNVPILPSSNQPQINPAPLQHNIVIPPYNTCNSYAQPNYRPQNVMSFNGPPVRYYSSKPVPLSQLGGKVPGYSGDLSLPRQSPEQMSQAPPHHSPVQMSQAPPRAYTPITVPSWPPPNLPVFYTQSQSTVTQPEVRVHQISTPLPAAPVISEAPESTSIPRPCTPLTPASAEVANICKLNRPSSTSSLTSHNSISNSLQSRSNSSNSGSNSAHRLDRRLEIQSEIEVEKVTASCEEPNVAIDVPAVVSLLANTLTKDSLSDDYASASENLDEVQHIANMMLNDQQHYASAPENLDEDKQVTYTILGDQGSVPLSKSPCESKSSEKIPDSWEDIEPDDTPAKAINFAEDFKQPLDLIIKDEVFSALNNSVPDVAKSAELKINSQLSPSSTITAPINWKDGFNPDAISSSTGCDKNADKRTTPSPAKFNVKKIPVQKLEIQGKFFHLVCVNDDPAILVYEFFTQFFQSQFQSGVAIKILEVHQNKITIISKTDNPAVLAELDKVSVFCGGVPKKTVIRLGKVMVLFLSQIPRCLATLRVINQQLLDDLKKISDEFKSC